MTIQIKNINQDEDNLNRWYFQVYGPDNTDSTVRIAIVDVVLGDGETPETWLAANLVTAQAAIDVGNTHIQFSAKEEIRNFLLDNPSAKSLIELAPDDLVSAIDSRTEGQETLLLKTLSFAVRYLLSELKT